MRRLGVIVIAACVLAPGAAWAQFEPFGSLEPAPGAGESYYYFTCYGGATYYTDAGPMYISMIMDVRAPNGELLHRWSGAAFGYIDHEYIAAIPWSQVQDGNYVCATDFPDPGGGQWREIRPRIPSDLHKSEIYDDTFTYAAPGDYLRTRVWQVWDWAGHWEYNNMPVWEDMNSSSNGCNLAFITSQTNTNWYGRFQDKYGNYDGNHAIQGCGQVSCTTVANQTISVVGFEFSHRVDYTCDSVTVYRQ